LPGTSTISSSPREKLQGFRDFNLRGALAAAQQSEQQSAIIPPIFSDVSGQKLKEMQNSACVHIDGSILEGGGQVVRIATCLSALLGSAVFIDKIRAGRSKPGLAGESFTENQSIPLS
jgi:hypothetical protein